MNFAELTPTLFYFVAILGLLVWVGLVVLLLAALTKPSFWPRLKGMITSKVHLLSLVLVTAATFGSLWLSDVAKITPCKLCWFQRIFMYPLVIIFLISLYKKQKVRLIALWMTGIGSLIAVYHYALQRLAFLQQAVPCQADASCATMYLGYFGWYSIPLMALTVFVAVFVLQFFFATNKH